MMIRLCATIGLALLAALPARAVELVMVEQPGCAYCAAWDDAIAPIYPKTDAGKFAPLRRVDLHDGPPEGITYARPARFTPTFIIIDDAGTEVARIEGYPGEDFFWGLLEKMLAENTDFLTAFPPQSAVN